MGFEVRQLLDRKAPPTTAVSTDLARSAVDQMWRYDFSQLPVVDGRKVVGLVSNESILRQLLHFGCSIDKLIVRDAMEKPNLIAPDAGLDELLDALSRESAALVVDRDHALLGIVTDYDTTAWFREDVEDRMHLADVEQHVRGLALRPFDGAAESPALKTVMRALGSSSQRSAFMKALNELGHKVEQSRSVEIFEKHFLEDREFHRLTFGDYIQLLDDKGRWATHLGVLLGDKRGEVVTVLKRVRDARNDIAHLRGLTNEQREDIRASAKWLARMMGGVASVTGSMPARTGSAPPPLVPPSNTEENPSLEDEVGADAATYTPLSRFLQDLPDDTGSVGMPFASIENILGRALPASARRHMAWWANDSTSHTQSKAWLEVGWKVSAARLDEDFVLFERVEGDRQQAYRVFFSELSRQLRERKKVPVSSAQALGRSWHSLASLRTPVSSAGWIGSSFAKGRRFRVEAYLRTGDAEKTKALFDVLYADKAAIEAEMGMELTWERLDHREASRIARYWEATIETEEPELDLVLRDAVQVAEKMYEAVSRRLNASF